MDTERLKELQKQIEQLPKGNITYKTIRGKKYPYYQWTEGGKQHGRKVRDEELQELSMQIKQRKML